MEEKVIEKNRDQQIAKKKRYTPPALTVYGKLGDLTGGGTSGSLETGNPGEMMMQTTRRP